MADMNRAYTGESHGSVGSYATGFVLSIVLTAAAFGLVMVPVLPHVTTMFTIAALAAVQVLVHLVCFLHMNSSSEQRWNVTAFAFAVLTVAILIVGSLWIMHNISEHMMGPANSHMPTEM